jgi:hypothetical protein
MWPFNSTKVATPPQESELTKLKESVEKKRCEVQLKLLESIWWDDGFGGSDLFDRMRGRDGEQGWVPLNVVTDRQRGQDWPMWRTEQELARLRNISRMVVSPANSYGRCLLENLTNAVVGKGFTYKVQPKKRHSPAPDEAGQDDDQMQAMVDSVQEFVDDFLQENRWNGVAAQREGANPNDTREREAFRRTHRDGEAFIRLYHLEEGELRGHTRIRFIEPEQVIQPPAGYPEVGWTFGIRHAQEPFEDVEAVEAYHVVWQNQTMIGPRQTPVGEIVDAAQIVHVKNAGTDAAVKRGMPTFVWDTADALTRASKLQKNLSMSAAIRAATAEIWKYTTATAGQISALMGTLTTPSSTAAPTPNPPQNLEKILPGTIRRIDQGTELVFPPGTFGVPEHLAAAQGDLRQASASVCAPEYFTGDASNANYASTQEAGTPFVRYGESHQAHFIGAYSCVVWRAIRWGVTCGLLRPESLTHLELSVTAPKVQTTKQLEQAQVNQILVPLGVKSPQTAAAELGLDPEVEQQNTAEYQDRMGTGSQLQLPGEDQFGGIAGKPPAKPSVSTQ